MLGFSMKRRPVVIKTPEVTLENASDTSDSSWSRRPSQVSHCSSLHSSFTPPEFVVCNASDSDSSRRVSRCSQASLHREIQSEIGYVSNVWYSYNNPEDIPPSRRYSSVATMSPPNSSGGIHLDVPQQRERNYSLPSTMLSEELYKMRMFSVQGKKVINHGDSVQSRRGSRSSMSSRGSGDSHSSSYGRPNTPRSDRSSARSSRANSRMSRQSSSPGSSQTRTPSRRNSDRGYGSSFRTSPLTASHSRCSSPCLLQLEEDDLPTDLVKVLIVGGAGVGKSSLCAQFVTSEYVNTYHQVDDSVCKEVNMSVNNEQFRLLFIDHKFGEMALEDQLSTYNPDAVLMVMAVDDEESLATAAGMLSLMKRTEVLDKLPVILVANKTDLVRSRSIKHSDGKCLARQFNVKYIETSPGINHNVDELLVGLVAQIKLRKQNVTKSEKSVVKLQRFLEKLVYKIQGDYKSCTNLNIL